MSDFKYIPEIKRIIEILGGYSSVIQHMKDYGKIPTSVLKTNRITLPHQLVNEFAAYMLSNNKEDFDKSKVPFVTTWEEWAVRYDEYINSYWILGNTKDNNPYYYNWKNIQMNRSKSELGSLSQSLAHGLCAFELSDGCSRGCRFCGLNAKPLASVFAYNEKNKKLWRGILKTMVNYFGEAVKTSICYWATEPSDNVDYFKFIRDFENIVGIEPQTTSAITRKTLPFIRQMADFHKSGNAFSRISVLSENILKEIHRAYSPQDLINIILLLQFLDKMKKAKSGRNVSEMEEPSGTIACITGYVINMCCKTVELISPCKASFEHPKGYKIFTSFTFYSIEDFEKKIRDSFTNKMRTSISPQDKIKLRNDISFELNGNELSFKSTYHEHKLLYTHISPDTIELIKDGKSNYDLIREKLLSDGGNFIGIASFMQILLNHGIIEIIE